MSSVSTAAHSIAWDSAPEDRSRPERRIPPIPPAAITAIALVIAVIVGRFFADGRMTLGAALVLAVCFGPLAFLNLTMALAVYIAILFIQDTAALSVGPNSFGVLVLLGWAGTLITRTGRRAVIREQRRLLLVLASFALWLTLSLIWAGNTGDTAIALETWLLAIVAFVLTITVVRSPRDVAIVAIAFIVGAVVSVAFGVSTGALSAAATSTTETAATGRLTGGGGDPNVQAAGFMIAMFLCAGLWSLAGRRLPRIGLVLAFIVVAVGFFATQSRGGLIALAVATIVGLAVLPRQRKRLLGLAGAAGVGLGVIALANPTAISRMTDLGGGTSGRSDLWTVAWNIFNDHPWIGIGLSNFQVVEPRYTLISGPLSRVDLVAESPHLVHNVYLQLLTETGVVGLALFLILVGGCLRASWLAAERFDVSGLVGYGDLARATLMAEIAMLTAQFFISDGDDWRLWILLGLGPVLLSIARRAPPLRPSEEREPNVPRPVGHLARR
jgi:O-antigen ligase